jgi:hypothetical protein
MKQLIITDVAVIRLNLKQGFSGRISLQESKDELPTTGDPGLPSRKKNRILGVS